MGDPHPARVEHAHHVAGCQAGELDRASDGEVAGLDRRSHRARGERERPDADGRTQQREHQAQGSDDGTDGQCHLAQDPHEPVLGHGVEVAVTVNVAVAVLPCNVVGASLANVTWKHSGAPVAPDASGPCAVPTTVAAVLAVRVTPVTTAVPPVQVAAFPVPERVPLAEMFSFSALAVANAAASVPPSPPVMV